MTCRICFEADRVVLTQCLNNYQMVMEISPPIMDVRRGVAQPPRTTSPLLLPVMDNRKMADILVSNRNNRSDQEVRCRSIGFASRLSKGGLTRNFRRAAL